MEMNHEETKRTNGLKAITWFVAGMQMWLLFSLVISAGAYAADKLPQVKLSVKHLDLSKTVSREDLLTRRSFRC